MAGSSAGTDAEGAKEAVICPVMSDGYVADSWTLIGSCSAASAELGSPIMAGCGIAGALSATEICNTCVAVNEPASVNLTVKLKLPLNVGVPLMTPPDELRLSPGGSAPAITDQE